jgi:hypothetical protein
LADAAGHTHTYLNTHTHTHKQTHIEICMHALTCTLKIMPYTMQYEATFLLAQLEYAYYCRMSGRGAARKGCLARGAVIFQ